MTASSSSEAVTVTDCAVFQLDVVKVRVRGDAETSAPAGTCTSMVTASTGCVSSATV